MFHYYSVEYTCNTCGYNYKDDMDEIPENASCPVNECDSIENLEMHITDNIKELAESWINGNKKHVYSVLKNDRYVFCCFLLALADLVENPMDFVEKYKNYLENY